MLTFRPKCTFVLKVALLVIKIFLAVRLSQIYPKAMSNLFISTFVFQTIRIKVDYLEMANNKPSLSSNTSCKVIGCVIKTWFPEDGEYSGPLEENRKIPVLFSPSLEVVGDRIMC